MLYIIGIGIVVIMLDVIFKIASAIYKNKFYRIILLTVFVVQLGLFYFWIYKNQLQIIYLYAWICSCFLLLLISILFALSMRGLVGDLYIQLLFVNSEELGYVINVFERYLNGEKVSLKLSEYDVNVQLFIEMGIFRIPDGISMEHIDRAVVYISKEHLKQYVAVKNRYVKG